MKKYLTASPGSSFWWSLTRSNPSEHRQCDHVAWLGILFLATFMLIWLAWQATDWAIVNPVSDREISMSFSEAHSPN